MVLKPITESIREAIAISYTAIEKSIGKAIIKANSISKNIFGGLNNTATKTLSSFLPSGNISQVAKISINKGRSYKLPASGDNVGNMLKGAADPKIKTWNEFQSANAGKYDNAGMSNSWAQYKPKNGMVVKTTTTGNHGNSLSNSNTNYGYSLVDKDTGEILKFGETIHPNSRYTREYLNNNNAIMNIMDSGSKVDMHNW
jgi:hypothetical protein